MSQSTRLVFFGSSRLSAVVLEELIRQPDFEVVCVVSKPAPAQGHHSTRDTPVAQLATKHGLKLLQPQRVADIHDELRTLATPLAVLFAFGQILPREILDIFPLGIINIHPSLLPRWRGPSPIEATILAGDDQAGTSLILLEPTMDTGPILAQKSWPLASFVSKAKLTEDLLTASIELLVPALRSHVTGTSQLVTQKEANATTCGLIKKSDGMVSLADETATSLERKVRAYLDWPTVSIPVRVGSQSSQLKLLATSILEPDTAHAKPRLFNSGQELILELAHGSVRIDKGQLPGRKIVTGSDLVNGAPLALDS